MQKYRFDCSKMTDDVLQEHINSFTDCGWEFDGFMNFPPPHIWACFTWNKNTEPIYPSHNT